jgi:hypothetical protein
MEIVQKQLAMIHYFGTVLFVEAPVMDCETLLVCIEFPPGGLLGFH